MRQRLKYNHEAHEGTKNVLYNILLRVFVIFVVVLSTLRPLR